MDVIKIGVLTSSDRASAGVYEDASGKAVMEVLGELIANKMEFSYKVLPDEFEQLKAALESMRGCDLVITTGGTGPAPRDIIPEVMEAVCEKMLPGFGEQMRSVSLRYVPTAILSRQSAGVMGHTLVVNLPGKPKSIRECLEAVFGAIPYCIDLIGGGYIEPTGKIPAFRPKG